MMGVFMAKKLFKMKGLVSNENAMIMAFSKIHDKIGFPEICTPSTTGFDIEDIIYEKNGKKQVVTIEFESVSKNFINHNHHLVMEKNKKYVLVCWDDNCNIQNKLKKEHHKKLYDVIDLKNFVEEDKSQRELITDTSDEPKHLLLSYNKAMASYSFSAWKQVNCFRVRTTENHKKFAKDFLPRGSKILFAQDGYLVGGFTVARYEVIDCPKTKNEKALYKKLMDYPNSLFEHDIEFDFNPEDFLRGHIFYEGFFELNVKLDWKKYLKNKNMRYDGVAHITPEEYRSFCINNPE